MRQLFSIPLAIVLGSPVLAQRFEQSDVAVAVEETEIWFSEQGEGVKSVIGNFYSVWEVRGDRVKLVDPSSRKQVLSSSGLRWVNDRVAIPLREGPQFLTTKIRKDPDSYVWPWRRGNVYKKLKDMDAAIRDFTDAIDACRDGMAHELYADRAEAYASKDQFDKAIRDIDVAIEKAPDSAKAEHFILRGLFRYVSGDSEGYEFDFLQAKLSDPEIEVPDDSDLEWSKKQHEHQLEQASRAKEGSERSKQPAVPLTAD